MKTKKEIESRLSEILIMLENPEETRNQYKLEKSDHYDEYPHFMLGYIKGSLRSILENQEDSNNFTEGGIY